MQHAVKGLETELDRLTSRLVNAMANRDSLEEVLVIVFVIFCQMHFISCNFRKHHEQN